MTDLIKSEVQQLEMPATVELFELDLSPIGESEVFRFFDGVNIKRQNIVWQGETYYAFPIKAGGFDMSTNGQLPRPKLRVSNVQGTITALLLVYNDLVGAKVTRRRTLSKYLDAVNFPGDSNPTADPDAAFADDIFFVDRKAAETDEAVELELAAAFDVTGVQLPRRQVVQNVCPWRYRSSECSYAGPPVADIRDNPISATVAVTAEEVAYFAARTAWLAARNVRIAAQQDTAAKQNALALASELILLETQYNQSYPTGSYVVTYNSGLTESAWWNSAQVTLGTTYRRGALQSSDTARGVDYYSIQRWGVDAAAQTAAQTAYNTSKSALTTAQGNEATALATYQASILALPLDGAVYSADVCGKRLTSCKMRFQQPDQSGVLPFGGFPAVGLVS